MTGPSKSKRHRHGRLAGDADMTQVSRDSRSSNKRKLNSRADAAGSSSKKSRPTESSGTLLVGDSILDNRAYATESTGDILSQLGTYVDHSVEETATHHFAQEQRVVPSMWYNLAAANGHPYAARDVALYPEGPFDRIVVSVGGNDIVLDPSIVLLLFFGKLEETIAERVLAVLNAYRTRYPSATVFYVRPYNLTAGMVEALAGRFNMSISDIQPNLHVLLNDVLKGVIARVGNAGFHIIDAKWRAEDVQVSQYGIPEPTTQGARRLADAIHASC